MQIGFEGQVALFLLSDQAGRIAVQLISVDGRQS